MIGGMFANHYSSPSGSTGPSDQERMAATRALMQAHQAGYISSEELIERMAQAEAATSSAELQRIARTQVEIRDSHRADSEALPVVAAMPSKIGVVLSERKIHHTAIPAKLETNAVMGSIRLDLRGGHFTALELTIHATLIMADLKIWVDEGVAVAQECTTVLAEVKTHGLQPRLGGPVVRLQGTCFMAEIDIYGPRHITLIDRIAGRF